MATNKSIITAIPDTLINDAMQVLGVKHKKYRKTRPVTKHDDGSVVYGEWQLSPVLDDDGVQLEDDGKFMDDTTVIAAYNDIKDNTSTVKLDTQKQSYLSLAAYPDIGIAGSAELETAVGAGISAGAISKWVDVALNGEGINVNDPQVESALTALISLELLTAILATGYEQQNTFQGLKPGQVQNALVEHYRSVK